MVRAWLKQLGKKWFGVQKARTTRPARRPVRLGLETLETRDVPSTLTHVNISAPVDVKAGAAFSITVTGNDENNNPYTGPVHIRINDNGHSPHTVTWQLSNGTFTPSPAEFNFPGTATFTDDRTIDTGVQITPTWTAKATVKVAPVLGIGDPSGNLIKYPSGNRLPITLTAYNGDGTVATDYNGPVTLKSLNTTLLYVDNNQGTMNADGSVTFTLTNGKSTGSISVVAQNVDPTIPYVLIKAFTTDPNNNDVVTSSQNLRIYIS
jgi:hypothetical protein